MLHQKNMPNVNKIWGENLVLLRQILGMNARGKPYKTEEFAVILGVSRLTLYRWERGNVPPKRKLEKLANYFSIQLGITITPADLLNEDLKKRIKVTFKEEKPKQSKETKIKLLKDLEIFARGNLTQEDLEKLVKIAKILRGKED